VTLLLNRGGTGSFDANHDPNSNFNPLPKRSKSPSAQSNRLINRLIKPTF